MYKIIETHCHLDYLKKRPLEEILQGAKEVGVEKIITIAVEPDNFDSVYNLGQEHEDVYYTQGIHPHDAKLHTEEAFQKILTRSKDPKMVAVGEIGLDYHYDNSPRDIQKNVFLKQIEMAANLDKPVVIHSRDACDDTIKILDEVAPSLKRKGVIHSFTSTMELAKSALDHGFYLGFNGIITFKSAQNVRDIVEMCPLERIVIETDAPFLTPVPHRGKENCPEYLPHIIEKIAQIKQVSPQEVADTCYKNAQDLFFF